MAGAVGVWRLRLPRPLEVGELGLDDLEGRRRLVELLLEELGQPLPGGEVILGVLAELRVPGPGKDQDELPALGTSPVVGVSAPSRAAHEGRVDPRLLLDLPCGRDGRLDPGLEGPGLVGRGSLIVMPVPRGYPQGKGYGLCGGGHFKLLRGSHSLSSRPPAKLSLAGLSVSRPSKLFPPRTLCGGQQYGPDF